MSTKHVLFDSGVKKEIQEHYDRQASVYDSEDSIDFRPENDYVFWHYLRRSLRDRSKNLILDVGEEQDG